MAHSAVSIRPVAFGWPLLAAALSLPWLMPIHARPWTGFHAEALMAWVLLLLLVTVWVSTRGRWAFPAASVAFMGLSVVPLLQHLGGLIYYTGDALLAGVYLLGFGLAVLVGRRMEDRWPGRLVPAVFASFGIAALVSFAIALKQWLQLDQWGAFTLSVGAGSRVVANVGQPNQLATLYVWGLLTFWWGFRRGIVRGWIVAAVAALLLFGIAMTQSRMGAIAVLAVMAVAIFHRRALSTNAHRWAVIGLFFWFLGCVLSWSALTALLELSASQSVGERLVPGTRLLHWQLIVDAILQRPLLGWGWQQVSVAQSALALQHPATGELIRSSHNVLLDLLLWNGLPLGLLIAFGIAFWYVKHWRCAQNVTDVAVMLALSVFLWHACLEQPHFSAIMLVPVGLLVGALSAASPELARGKTWSAREAVVASLVMTVAACAFLVTRDYFRIEAAWMAERLRAARIGSLVPAPLPDAPTLGHLGAVLELARIEPRVGMTVDEIEAMRQVTYRMAGVGGMLKLAQAQALNGQASEATLTLRRLCQTHPKPVCERALMAWSRIAP